MNPPRNIPSVGSETPFPVYILSVGKNPSLMSSRSLLLRAAGYRVEEAYTVDKAVNLVEEDFIDAMLLCHTISRDDKQVLISTVRRKRPSMPVLCLRSYAYESVPRTCIAVDNDPEEMLNALRNAVISRRPDSIA